MPAYYNEFKPEAAHMLRQLIKDGLIADGDVDERSIVDVRADDLRGYEQCHFFAGIGGWSVALRLAGWPDSRPVWTGSCPCQPFSTAGAQKGHSDERHLWPHWARLIRESKPPTIFGEQVAGAVAFGWLDEVFNDLEAEAYACASAILPACSVGLPHKRDRLWFVAQSTINDDRGSPRKLPKAYEQQAQKRQRQECNAQFSSAGTLGNTEHNGQSTREVAGSEGQAVFNGTQRTNRTSEFAGTGQSSNVADTEYWGRQGQGALGKPLHTAQSGEWQTSESFDDSAGLQWIQCPDGKARPVKRGIRLLAHGVQHRAPILHAFGNAIVPPLAKEFIEAFMSIENEKMHNL